MYLLLLLVLLFKAITVVVVDMVLRVTKNQLSRHVQIA